MIELRRNNEKARFGRGGSRGNKGGGRKNQRAQQCFLIFNLLKDTYNQN